MIHDLWYYYIMKKKATKAERREEKARRKMRVHGRGMRDLAARLTRTIDKPN